VIAVDTSVVVAAFASWHEGHATAVAALARGPRLPAHAAVETFSVLTRLPPPHRAPPDLVAAFLRARFRESLLVLSAKGYRALIREACAAQLSGGAIYDALIAAIAKERGATLLSRDRRAVGVYDLMGAAYELLL
jgi:predicted nucleic acid-binding protein